MSIAVVEIIYNYRQAFISGLSSTMELCVLVWVLGICFGVSLGFLSFVIKPLGVFTKIISFVLTGTPVLVFLFWLHYPAQSIFDVVIDPFYTACFAFTLINIFSVSELIRSQLLEFPKEYNVVAKVYGLTSSQIFLKIQLPIIFRQVIPSLIFLQVSMLHMTLFASLISVEELFRMAQVINSRIYKPVEIYSALAIFFIAICLPLNGLACYLKNKYSRNLSER